MRSSHDIARRGRAGHQKDGKMTIWMQLASVIETFSECLTRFNLIPLDQRAYMCNFWWRKYLGFWLRWTQSHCHDHRWNSLESANIKMYIGNNHIISDTMITTAVMNIDQISKLDAWRKSQGFWLRGTIHHRWQVRARWCGLLRWISSWMLHGWNGWLTPFKGWQVLGLCVVVVS